MAFNGIRSAAFPDACFEKDSDVSLGTKGDYIFRDFDEDGIQKKPKKRNRKWINTTRHLVDQ